MTPFTALSCAGPQSALAPAGRDAASIHELTLWMGFGSLILWAIVLGLMARAFWPAPAHPPRVENALVLVGGVAVPVVLLTTLLIVGLPRLPRMLDPGPPGPVRLSVVGELWWWRVRYETPRGTFELGNELALPVGERVGIALTSPEVIHSLWVPSLAGKMDLVPGRTTALALEPTLAGRYRGACAEFCGGSHTWMDLWVVALPRAEFDAWLAREASPAAAPVGPEAERGSAVFHASGCGGCHTVRGTSAAGTIGPDLTHVGSRQSIGAGRLPNDPDGFRVWLAHTGALKPDVRMPSFDMLSDGDLRALAAYLEGLQ